MHVERNASLGRTYAKSGHSQPEVLPYYGLLLFDWYVITPYGLFECFGSKV